MRTLKFIAGREYSTPSIGDQNCIYRFTVTRRTAKTVWITGGYIKEPSRRTITVSSDGTETIMPLGRYSMAPMLRADK